ncbi:MAG: motility protein A [Candidatus Cloacimonadota bacterium]|nr:MAG: motility protein A [Candidatus Cloacimonadota bacterium]
MDLGTLAGVIVGLGLILGAILLGGNMGDFVDIPSLMIVVGGTIAGIFIAYPIKTVFKIFKVVKNAFFNKPRDIHPLIEDAAKFSNIVKAQGAIALEKEAKGVSDEFFRKGLQMIADGTSPAIINDIMSGEIALMKERHNLGKTIFDDLAKFAPAFGMIGTLIGLVQMLAGLDDPSSIGPKMAVALLTTFYGSVIANLFCTPIAIKLKGRSEEQTLAMRLIQESIRSIARGDSRSLIEDKLAIFLSGEMRKKMASGK